MTAHETVLVACGAGIGGYLALMTWWLAFLLEDRRRAIPFLLEDPAQTED